MKHANDSLEDNRLQTSTIVNWEALSLVDSRVEIRFSNLSVTAKVPKPTRQPQHADSRPELPTVWNVLKSGVANLVPITKMDHLEILKGVSGVLRPGTMTLVLGQPGSGKSTLLKVLSGRLREDGNLQFDADRITYNGKSLQSLGNRVPQLTAYVPQRDQHFPLLTVKETLAFAHAFTDVGTGKGATSRIGQEEDHQAQSNAHYSLARSPEVVMNQLGLQNCWNTIVGDGMVRGVSGGEKKRVTTGEMEISLHQAVFMDEISTGLDSAATFDIVSTQRSMAKKMGKTIVISLLQPTPNVFDLFDDVILLHDGEVMYYGPCERVAEYFRGLGLVCPPDRDIADFLLDLGTPQQVVYEHSPLAPPRHASSFAEVFRQSDIYHSWVGQLECQTSVSPTLLTDVQSCQSFSNQCGRTH